DNMSAVVKSFFNNYTYYKWQKSTDNGATWTNDGPAGGPATPTLVGGSWQYSVTHPSFVVNPSDSGTKYRLVIATTSTNLNNAQCSFSASAVITLHVINCGNPLAEDTFSFTAKLESNLSHLTWTTSKEKEPLQFIVERSPDGISFN